jgi:DNA-directed RNA polymerase specialized sigma24 family protein
MLLSHHATAAELELLSGLARFPSRWAPSDWRRTLFYLTGRERRAVVLRVLWGLSVKGLAERLGCRKKAAWQSWDRAVRKLRKFEPTGGY